MKNGNWIPIDKNSRYLLPKNRPYTKIEAMISYTIDVDENTEKTISDYSRIWDWSRNKVRLFIENIRTGKGQVKDREGTGKGHTFRHIINNLEQTKDNERTGKGQVKDSKRTTTIKPNPNPKEKESKYIEIFEKFWLAYPERNGKKLNKQKAKEQFLKLKDSDIDLLRIAIPNYKNSGQMPVDAFRFIRDRSFEEWQTPATITSKKSQTEIKPMSNVWNRN